MATGKQIPFYIHERDNKFELSTTMDLSTLENHLWESANILRGPVDAADFKTYIFPMLFFKRISDVHDEEFEQAMEESGGDLEYATFAENYRFQIPDNCHWKDVRAVTKNVGQALQYASREIEKANPDRLFDIFGDAQWGNKDRLSDALLRDLIDHFSRLKLGNIDVEADILGQAYEYLIKKFADQTNKKAGEFYTPADVVRILVEIVDPRSGMSVYDPTVGSGGMLIQSRDYVRECGGDPRDLSFYGQDSIGTTWSVCGLPSGVTSSRMRFSAATTCFPGVTKGPLPSADDREA